MARLNREGLEESNADADDAHRHAATDQQQKAHAEAQTDLGHDESAVRRVEAVDGVVPAHCWKCGQNERDHPDAHHSVHSLLLGVTQPVVDRPAHHPHAVVRQRGDGEAGDQRERVEGGDKHLAQTLIPFVVGVLAPQCYDTVHGNRDGHIEDVRARQCADEEFQWLPLFLLGADAKDAPSICQDGHTRADQPSQRVGVDDVILHGGHLIHHVGAGQGAA